MTELFEIVSHKQKDLRRALYNSNERRINEIWLWEQKLGTIRTTLGNDLPKELVQLVESYVIYVPMWKVNLEYKCTFYTSHFPGLWRISDDLGWYFAQDVFNYREQSYGRANVFIYRFKTNGTENNTLAVLPKNY